MFGEPVLEWGDGLGTDAFSDEKGEYWNAIGDMVKPSLYSKTSVGKQESGRVRSTLL
jgi:hypothetical protein